MSNVHRRDAWASLYELERTLGYDRVGTYIAAADGEFDASTGEKTEARVPTILRNLIALDETLYYEYIESGPLFSQIQMGDKFFILITRHLPVDFKIRRNDFIEYSGYSYMILEALELDDKAGYVAHGRRTKEVTRE